MKIANEVSKNIRTITALAEIPVTVKHSLQRPVHKNIDFLLFTTPHFYTILHHCTVYIALILL